MVPNPARVSSEEIDSLLVISVAGNSPSSGEVKVRRLAKSSFKAVFIAWCARPPKFQRIEVIMLILPVISRSVNLRQLSTDRKVSRLLVHETYFENRVVLRCSER